MADIDLKPFENLLNCNRKADYAFLHKYKGYGIHESECTINIWIENKKAMVLFVDVGRGTSVINSAETLITEIFTQCLKKLGINQKDCLFLESSEERKRKSDLLIPEWGEIKFSVALDINGENKLDTEVRDFKCKKVTFKYLGKIL